MDFQILSFTLTVSDIFPLKAESSSTCCFPNEIADRIHVPESPKLPWKTVQGCQPWLSQEILYMLYDSH